MRRSGRAPTSPSSSGVIKYLLENDKNHKEYVRNYTNAAYIVKDGYGFQDGLFTGYDEDKRDLRQVHLGIRARAGRLRRARHDASAIRAASSSC